MSRSFVIELTLVGMILSGLMLATSPPSTEPINPTSPTTSPTTSAGRAAPSSPLPEPLPAGTSGADALAAAKRITGPSNDPLGELNRFVAVEGGLPTPLGASIVAFDVQSFVSLNVLDPDNPYVATAAQVTCRVPGSFDDVVVFFQTMMVVAGFEQVGDSRETNDTRRVRRLGFVRREQGPDSGDTLFPEFEIEIVDAAGEPTSVEISQSISDADPRNLARYAEMSPGAPLFEASVITAAGVSLDDDFDTATITLSYEVVGTQDVVVDRFEEALPTSEYALDEPWNGAQIRLSSPDYDRVSVSFYENVATPGEPTTVEVTLRGAVST